MTSGKNSSLNHRLGMLMKDFGYTLQGNRLIQKAEGFMPSRLVGTYSNIQCAAEALCPIIADDEYTKRLTELTSGANHER